MNEGNPAAVLKCPHCGADLYSPGNYCWLCRGPLASGQLTGEGDLAPVELVPERAPWTLQLLVLRLVLVITFLAVLVGVWIESPGLGILLAIAALPALVVTVVLSASIRAHGQSLSLGLRWLTFVVTFLSTAAVLALIVGIVMVALFIAAMQECFQKIGKIGPG